MNHAYLWVEGDDDERFVKSIFVPYLTKFEHTQVVRYASMKDKKISDFLKSVDKMNAASFFFADRDSAATIDDRVSGLRRRYSIPDTCQVIIVCREIEGWYLAGIDNLGDRRRWDGDAGVDVNAVTKATFNSGQPRRFRVRTEWMIELLRSHEPSSASMRSPSYQFARVTLDLQEAAS